MTRWTFPKLHRLEQHKLETLLSNLRGLFKTMCTDWVFQSGHPHNDTSATKVVHLN